jgi:hypothetical protein
MLANARSSRSVFTYKNWGNSFGTSAGASVAPGNGSKGSWVVLATPAQMEFGASGFHLWIHSGSTASASRPLAIDLGIDYAGGTSYTVVIPNMIAGNAATVITAGGGHRYFFPLTIPAGARVAIRGLSNATTAFRAGFKVYGKLVASETIPQGKYVRAFGHNTGSAGTVVTPGNGAFGSYVELGTTDRGLWWWQLAHQIDNATITAQYTYLELSYGNASAKHTILEKTHQGDTSERIGDVTSQQNIWHEGYCSVPAGATLYARAWANGAPNTGYQVMAIGVGG